MEIKFTIHMQPVAKGRPKFRYTGKFVQTYTPKETRVAENNILAQALKYKPAMPLQDRAHVALTFYMPIPKSMTKKQVTIAQLGQYEGATIFLPHTKKPDIDNLSKAVFDSLNGVFWRDDSIIWSVIQSKKYGLNPRIDVLIQGE